MMSNQTPVVLLTDPEQRACLAAARALGAQGWLVHTIGETAGLAGRSRFTVRHHGIPVGAASNPEQLCDRVRSIVAAYGVRVVIPVTDAASRTLLGQDAALGAVVAGPTPEAYARASDKAFLTRAAAQCGLRVPRQVELAAPPASLHLSFEVPPPLVLKPSRSVVMADGRIISTAVQFIDTAGDLTAALAQIAAEAYPLLLQERIVGEGVGVFLLRHGGTTYLRFGHRRLREKPPAGGVSTYREAVNPPADLVARCERLLDHLDYSGAAMLEFKRDVGTGEYVVMEVNARLWGSVQLAVDAGVNFPVALAELALGRDLEPLTACIPGTRSVWELGELDHAWALLRRSAAELHLPPDVRVGFPAAVRALLDHRVRDRCEVFRWSDPGPFLAELSGWLRRR